MRAILFRHAAALVALLLSAICGVTALARLPAHGLLLTKFSDPAWQEVLGPPTLDSAVYFASDEPWHPVPLWLTNNSSARWEGYLQTPRTGEYVLKLISDDGSELFVDGARVIANGGPHPPRGAETRLTLTKGFHAVRIDFMQVDGGAELRFEWRTPSGYNTIGLVPLSMLTPSVPPPLTWVDRALRILTNLFLLLALALLFRKQIAAWAQRRRSDPRAGRKLAAGVAVFGLVLGVRLYDLNGQGETCDEWAYVGAGQIYADNIAAGVFDPDQWKANREHPAMGKLLYGWVSFNLGDSQTASRAGSAVLNSLTVVLAFLTALRLLGLDVAVMTGIILAFLPSFVAHGKISALDCPATFFLTLSFWCFFSGLQDARRRNIWFIGLGVALGLGIATKLTNGLMLPYVLAVYPLVHWRSLKATGEVRVPWPLYVLPIAALTPFFATWPWLWRDLPRHLTETLNHWGFTPHELFLGTEFATPPVSYFLVCFAAVTPVLLAPFLITALAQLFRNVPCPVMRGESGTSPLSDHAWWFLLVTWFLLPFAWSFAGFRMDGVRYVYSAFPPFAILTAAGIALTARKLSAVLANRGRQAWAGRVMPAFGVTVGAYLLICCATVHPYYLDYFNEAVGGAGGAYRGRLFETGWWGEGIDRLVAYLNEHAERGATYKYKGGVDHTFSGLRADLKPVTDNPDYFATTDVGPRDQIPAGYSKVYSVQVMGAPIVAVYRSGQRSTLGRQEQEGSIH